MQFPRANNPQFMDIPSRARSPVAKVRFNRSEPAKSTKWNLDVNVSKSFSVKSFFDSSTCCLRMNNVNTA